MNKEEIEDILEELHLVRPEILKPKAKKLFEAIMSIADERDELQQENKKYKEVIDKAIEYMKDFIFEPLLTNEDRKLIMYNDNLRNFEKILKEVE